MEFLKLVKRRRSLASELVYAGLNIGLAVALVLVVMYTESIWFAIGLVLLSKWRVFAVRPRYWWVNLQSNTVDFIVSISVVIFLGVTHTALLESSYLTPALAIIALAYIGWLLYVKPRSARPMIVAQALSATFLGTAALATVSYSWPATFVVLMMWVIGYASTRHILLSYNEETHATLLSLSAGLIMAEIGWVAYHWTIAYGVPGFAGLQVPQVSIISVLLAFVMYKAYDSFHHHAKIRSADVLLPFLLAISTIAIMVLLFNRVGDAI